MAVADFRICPSCGTRNKKGWEYCARCGEDLHGVALGEPAPPEDVAAGPAAEGTPWLGLVGVFVFIGVAAYAGTRVYRVAGDPAKPDPVLFEIPTPPPSTSAARPDVTTPAQDAYDEGRRLFAQGDTAGAARALARAVADEPDNPEYRNAYAKALLASGGPDVETIRQFESAIRLAPEHPQYAADLARAYDRLGRNEEAAAAYARALVLAPNDRLTLREVSSLHARAGHPEAALPYLIRLTEVAPDDLVARQDLGLAYEKSGDKDGAKDTYRSILDKFPEAAVTRGLLSEILLKEGKSDEAIAVLRAGLEATPDAPLLHRTLGSALERSGNVADAIREYREYARLNPDAADAKAMADRAARLEARVAQNQSS
jgi:Flp pilus assembly protein TadD